MANGNSFLPQSQIPLGQVSAQLTAPRVNPSIPQPLDMTNFFRMQQGIRENMGMLQRNEMLKLRRKELEQRIHENKMREVESMLALTNDMFSQQYNQYSAGKNAQQSSDPLAGSILEGLNPRFAGHDAVIRENQDLYQAAQGELDILVKDYLSSNNSDPSVRYETVRRMRNVMGDYKNKMMRNKRYRDYITQQRNFDNWLLGIRAAQKEGKDVDWDGVRKRVQEYEAYANGDSSINYGLGDWNVNDYAYDGKGTMNSILTTTDSLIEKEAEAGTEMIPVEGGGFLVGDVTTRLSRDQITDAVLQQYENDPAFNKLFENAQRPIPRYDENGDPVEYTKRNFVEDLIRNRLPERDARTVTAKGQTVINQPKQTTEGTDPTYRFVDLTEGKVGNEGFAKNNRFLEDLVKAGVNPYGVRGDGAPVRASDIADWANIVEKEGEHRRFRYVDSDGNEVPASSDDAQFYEVYTPGFEPTDGSDPVPSVIHGRFDLLKNKPLETPEYKLEAREVPGNLETITQDTVEAQGLDRFIWKEEVNALHPEAVGVVKDIPEAFDGMTITDTYRTEEMNQALDDASPNSIHKIGRGLDIANDEKGDEFYEWTKTDEGKAWLDEHNYAIEEHGGDHYHMYPRESREEPAVSNEEGVDVHKVKSMSPESVYDRREEENPVTMAGNDKSMDIADKILMGLTTENGRVTADEVSYLLNNPPTGTDELSRNLRTAIGATRESWDKQNALQAQRSALEEQQQMLVDLGAGEDDPKVLELEGRITGLDNEISTFEDATSVEAFGELMRLELMEAYADRNKEQILQDFADPSAVSINGKESHVSTLTPGGEQVLEFIEKPLAGSTGIRKKQQNGSYVRRSKDGNTYIVIPMYGDETIDDIKSNISEDSVWDRRRVLNSDEFNDYVQNNKKKITDETVDRIANYSKISTDYINEAKERYFSRAGIRDNADTTEKRIQKKREEERRETPTLFTRS